MISMIKATRFFFFDVDTSNCKAMISMIKATRFFLYSVKPRKRNCLIRFAQSSDRTVGQQRDRFVKGDLQDVVQDTYRVILYVQNVT